MRPGGVDVARDGREAPGEPGASGLVVRPSDLGPAGTSMTYGSMSIVQTIVVRALMPVIVSVSVQPVALLVFDVPVVLVQE